MSLAGHPGVFGSRFHNYLYEALGLDYVYKAFTTTDLAAAIGGLRALGIRGCAISMPFKETVMPFLDQLEPSVTSIGSVNTVVNDAGTLIGHNTDYSAVRTLIAQIRPAPEGFILRGSGGMATAVAAALFDLGISSGTVVSRNRTAGETLAEKYGLSFEEELDAAPAGLIVNATPLGMDGPYASVLSFPEHFIAAADVAFDVVASPERTSLLTRARRMGKMTISGADVAGLQALEQFVLYTDVQPSAELAAAAARYARDRSSAQDLA